MQTLTAVLQQRLNADGDAVARAGVGKDRGAADDEHQTTGALGRVIQQSDDVLPLQLLIDNGADKQAVYRGHGRRLCGGEVAAVDAAEDNDGHQQTPEGALERAPHLAPALPRVGGLQVVLVRIDLHHEDHGRAHDDAGENTGHEDIAYGNAGQGGVNHEGNARRDDDRDRGRGGDHAVRERIGEFLALDHGGDQDNAQRRHGGRAGAGNRAEEAGHDDADHRDAAAQIPKQGVDERDQPVGDAGFGHDVAREDEERNGQQQILADAAVDLPRDDVDARPVIQDGEQRGHAQRQRDGRAQKQQDDENAQHNGIGHAASPPSGLSAPCSVFSSPMPSRIRSAVWITIRKAPSGMKAL